MQKSHKQKFLAILILEALITSLVIIIATYFIISAYANTRNPSYDMQLGYTLTGNYPNLTYFVTADSKSNSAGIGPAYLINGYSNTGYWYQSGITYNWSRNCGAALDCSTHHSGFAFLYEVFYQNASPFNRLAGAILGNFTGTVNNGDTIRLNMHFYDGNVIMSAYDLNSGSSASMSFNAFNATYFVGGPYTNGYGNGTANYDREYTGLLTEWYNTKPSLPMASDITYSSQGNKTFLGSGWISIGYPGPNTYDYISCIITSDCETCAPNNFNSTNSVVECNKAYELVTKNEIIENIRGTSIQNQTKI